MLDHRSAVAELGYCSFDDMSLSRSDINTTMVVSHHEAGK